MLLSQILNAKYFEFLLARIAQGTIKGIQLRRFISCIRLGGIDFIRFKGKAQVGDTRRNKHMNMNPC